MKKGKKHTVIGPFGSERDAAMAYDKAARKYYGKYSFQNFPKIGVE